MFPGSQIQATSLQADTTSNYHMDNMYLSINVVCKDSDTVSLNHNLRSAQGFTVASIHFN